MGIGLFGTLLSDDSANLIFDNHQDTMGNAGIGFRSIEKIQFGELPFQYTDSLKFQDNHNQPIFVNPVSQFQ